MSYEIVKAIHIRDGEVWIKSDSNNVFPKHFHWWHCPSLTKILQEKGQEALDKEILYCYWSGNFQKTGNNYDKSVKVMTDWKVYNWEYIPFNCDKEKRIQLENEIKEYLYKNYVTYNHRHMKKVIARCLSYDEFGNYFVRRKKGRNVLLTQFKESAKIFGSLEDAKFYLRDYDINDYELTEA